MATRFSSQMIRQAASEFIGVMILTIFGTGGICQVVLSTNTSVASTPKGVSTSTEDLCDLL
jgi:glycerol uptake facilitator-like aquaporin